MIEPVDLVTILSLISTGGTASGNNTSSGSSSNLAWKPTVSASGDISWTLTSNTSKPVTQNIRGENGRGINTVTLTSENHVVITYDDSTSMDIGEIKTLKGDDGYSPVITVSEDTETSYKLLITTNEGSFETPNLRVISESNGEVITPPTITIDSELSETSENAVQNKVISKTVTNLLKQVSNLSDIVSGITIGGEGGSIKVATLWDCDNPDEYKDFWSFKNSQWDNRVFSFEETATKNTVLFDEETGYLKFSNSFGWSADVTAVCSKPVQMNDRSFLKVDYNCSSDGNGITAEILTESDFASQKTADFEMLPAFYTQSVFLSANFETSLEETGEYFLRLKVNTTNSAFTIRKISVVTYDSVVINYSLREEV